jgi:DNA-directed RNA polymerase specialized sigma24 family protein
MPATAKNDAEILAGLRRYDPAALGQFYDCHAHAVYSCILEIVHDPKMTEELVVEMFLSVWNQARQFDFSGPRQRSIAENIAVRRQGSGR